jgi:ribosome-interacting GTPase 1
MNFEFADQINTELANLEFFKALDIAETALKHIPSTDFHFIVGKSLIHQADSLVTWIDNFHKSVSKKMDTKTLYFEMNEFDINIDTWYIDGFAFNKDGGLDLDDMEWLCDVTKETITKNEFILTGYEKLQQSFADIEEDVENDELCDEIQSARDWAEQIIITRFMELMRTVHLNAKELNLNWASIPIYFTVHSYEFVVKSEN